MDSGVDDQIVFRQIVPGLSTEKELGGFGVSGSVIAVEKAVAHCGVTALDREGNASRVVKERAVFNTYI